MKRSRHQLAPAVPVQEVIDRAVAGRMPDRFLVGRLEIVDVQHLPGAGRFGKPREQGFFFGQRHVLVLASAIRLGFEGLDAAVVIGHVRTVHRAQRHAHCSRNRRLGHPTLTQQHHLDALALRRRYLPAQRSFQPPHLGFAAFDHLFPSNPMAQANHTSGEENSPRLSAKNPDSSRYGGGISVGWRVTVASDPPPGTVGITRSTIGTIWQIFENSEYGLDRLCVQRRLACSAGDRPAGARVRSPVVWIAGWRETKTLKPIDKVSPGEITSHRAVTTVNAQVASKMSESEGRACN